MASPQTDTDVGRDESPKERLDRNLDELLQGLRVAITGVQVLFAFLLVLPFQSGFPDVTAFQEKVYFATLLCTAIASVFLIAPSARHRIRFRQDDKAYVVFSANRLAIGGLAFLGLGMVGGGAARQRLPVRGRDGDRRHRGRLRGAVLVVVRLAVDAEAEQLRPEISRT